MIHLQMVTPYFFPQNHNSDLANWLGIISGCPNWLDRTRCVKGKVQVPLEFLGRKWTYMYMYMVTIMNQDDQHVKCLAPMWRLIILRQVWKGIHNKIDGAQICRG